MDIAALIAWVLTALGGLYMLGTWIQHAESHSSSPAPAACPRR
ncbi:hypothetical protein ACFYZJ_10215 [Streptomyces sp. NPDC001848]